MLRFTFEREYLYPQEYSEREYTVPAPDAGADGVISSSLWRVTEAIVQPFTTDDSVSTAAIIGNSHYLQLG